MMFSLCSKLLGELKKIQVERLGFFHLTEGQHHFEQSENIISHSSGHKTMLRQAANDVMLRINDVALRANTTLVFAP
jgi:hypothetical protein